MAVTHSEVTNHLKSLLPQGKAYNLEDSSNLSSIMKAISDEIIRIDLRIQDLIREMDPTNSLELLSDWESLVGKDACFTETNDVSERRARILLKLRSRGGQSKEFFINLIKALGFDIIISEFRPFTAGMEVGGELSNDDKWRFVFEVKSLQSITTYLRAGSEVGLPLVQYKNELVECLLNRLKPSHTKNNIQF